MSKHAKTDARSVMTTRNEGIPFFLIKWIDKNQHERAKVRKRKNGKEG
jgi:hypothetical protein